MPLRPARRADEDRAGDDRAARRAARRPAPGHRVAAALGLLVLTTGCAVVGVDADRAGRVGPERGLSAAELRAAALGDADLGPGYVVTVMTPGHGERGPADGREVTDLPACQPVLDAVTAAGPPGRSTGPAAETDLSVARPADPTGSVYVGLLGHRPGLAAQLQTRVEQVLDRCGSFTSTTAAGGGAASGRRPVSARHRLGRADTPTTEGADAVTGFTLTNESGGVTLTQRAVLARVGSVLAVFSTVGVGAEPAAVPDERIVRQQLARLRAAQRGR
ncbi:hypothetical protein [Kitasatospora sp. NBC_00315]|uniref:hypothetical protein n=1 Tax=Kitasatospora sp. NBC_00315 TaxID=2975963 RepID=UPI0032459F34